MSTRAMMLTLSIVALAGAPHTVAAQKVKLGIHVFITSSSVREWYGEDQIQTLQRDASATLVRAMTPLEPWNNWTLVAKAVIPRLQIEVGQYPNSTAVFFSASVVAPSRSGLSNIEEAGPWIEPWREPGQNATVYPADGKGIGEAIGRLLLNKYIREIVFEGLRIVPLSNKPPRWKATKKDGLLVLPLASQTFPKLQTSRFRLEGTLGTTPPNSMERPPRIAVIANGDGGASQYEDNLAWTAVGKKVSYASEEEDYGKFARIDDLELIDVYLQAYGRPITAIIIGK